MSLEEALSPLREPLSFDRSSLSRGERGHRSSPVRGAFSCMRSRSGEEGLHYTLHSLPAISPGFILKTECAFLVIRVRLLPRSPMPVDKSER